MSPILVVEPNMTGHRPYYVRLLVEQALQLGNDVVVASRPSQLESEDARPHLEALAGRFQVAIADGWTLESLSQLSRELGTEITVVPDGDRFAMKLALSNGWRGSGTLSLLVMREVAQRHRVTGVQAVRTVARKLLFRRANGFPNVRASLLKSAWWAGSSKMPIVRDPITLRASDEAVETVAREWDLTGDRYWFAVLGAISRRKNVDLVARALCQIDPGRVGLLVAGAWDADMGDEPRHALDELSSHGVRVVTVDRILTDEELDAAVQRADCLVLAHSNEGPSGLLGKAAAAGTRIIAAGAESLRSDMDHLIDLGVWVTLDVSSLKRAITDSLARPRPTAQPRPPIETFAQGLLHGVDGDSRGVQR